jgi:Mg-chelatase subunit ChlD
VISLLDSKQCQGGYLRRTSIAIAASLAVAVAACTQQSGDREDSASSDDVANQKYVPSIDEGLGASIAILVDNSGSMARAARGDDRPKFEVARQALDAMIASTDSFVAKQPGFPVKVGLYQFSSDVETLVPVQAYNRAALRQALESMPAPKGGTAIGRAMDVARADLYRAGTIRKYILVVTDGENTDGPSPRKVAREIFRRSEGAVRMYFVAFDVDARTFDFLPDVHGEVLGASNGVALRASLDTIYRGKILAEATDAGETLPGATADSAAAHDSVRSKNPTAPRSKKP